MAITINGSGTITGISAGGLPDGVVTAADLASGAITSGALPAGSVLQVQSRNWAVATNVSSFSGALFSHTITVQEGSRIVAQAVVPRYTNASANAWGQAFQLNLWLGAYSTGTLLQDQEHTGDNSNTAGCFNHAMLGQTEPLTAGTYTITVGGQSVVNTNAHQFNRTPRSSWLTLMEIAG